MVGKGLIVSREYKLGDVLTDKQVHCIIKQLLSSGLDWRVVCSEVRPASAETSGFVGEYFNVTLHVTADGASDSLRLFVKRVPFENQPKADFINSNNFYKREALVYRLIKEITFADDPHPWCTRALVHNESILVMLDVRSMGYSSRPQTEILDLPHVLTTLTSIARLHASFANYEVRKTRQTITPWTISQEYGNILDEPTFTDSPWLRCSAKLTANLLVTFSKKYNKVQDLETKLTKLFLEACDDLKEYENTFNVIVHKDLWINNIMYLYEKDVPVNALLLDYQCFRYGPPTFDVMMFLYLNTSRSFREQNEQMVLKHYYSVFVDNLEDSTKQRLKQFKYDEREFMRWCERSRRFGMLGTIAIFPYALMDPTVAKKTFDDPDTYQEYLTVDRTTPVVAHCLQSSVYQHRQLEVCEEFVERYVEK